MNFTRKIKNEIAHFDEQNLNLIWAEFCGVLFTLGKIEFSGEFIEFSFCTKSTIVARRVTMLIRFLNIEQPLVTATKKNNKNNISIIVIVNKERVKILAKHWCISGDQVTVKADIVDDLFVEDCMKKAFIRGAFLGAGNFVNPRKDYHVDITLKKEDISEIIVQCLKFFSIHSKVIERRQKQTVYINRMDGVADFLNIIGAHSALLEYENEIIIKEMRNKANRGANCVMANLNKVVNKAVEQINSILYIEQQVGLNALPSNLQFTAHIRLMHPEESLSELEVYFDGLSKSGIRHRLEKICSIAKFLKNSSEK